MNVQSPPPPPPPHLLSEFEFPCDLNRCIENENTYFSARISIYASFKMIFTIEDCVQICLLKNNDSLCVELQMFDCMTHAIQVLCSVNICL